MTGSTADRRRSSRLICGRHPSLLAGDEDPELVIGRRIVAAISLVGEDARDGVADQRLHLRDHGCQRVAVIGIAGQRLHMGDELAALGVLERGGNADLDAELVRPVGLALADALDFRRVQGIDLRPALTLLLLAHAARQRQQLGERRFEPAVALDLAADVADDAAEIGPQLLQHPVGALELLGVGIALMLDQGELAHPRIGLAQTHAVVLRQPHQLLARPVQKLGIGGEHHVLGLHRGVDDHPRQLGRLDRLGPGGDRQALLQQRLQPLLAHAVAPARQRRAIEHQPVLEELLAAEELVIGVLDPALAQHLVGQVIGVLEDRQPRHQSRRQRRLARIVRVDRPELPSRNPQSTVRASFTSGWFMSMI